MYTPDASRCAILSTYGYVLRSGVYIVHSGRCAGSKHHYRYSPTAGAPIRSGSAHPEVGGPQARAGRQVPRASQARPLVDLHQRRYFTNRSKSTHDDHEDDGPSEAPTSSTTGHDHRKCSRSRYPHEPQAISRGLLRRHERGRGGQPLRSPVHDAQLVVHPARPHRQPSNTSSTKLSWGPVDLEQTTPSSRHGRRSPTKLT